MEVFTNSVRAKCMPGYDKVLFDVAAGSAGDLRLPFFAEILVCIGDRVHARGVGIRMGYMNVYSMLFCRSSRSN